MTGVWRAEVLRRPHQAILFTGFVVLLGLQIVFMLRHNINWDEFYFLSLIHDAQRGTLENPLRTIHVHLFGWVARLPGNEVQQVIAGRWGMFLAQLVTLSAIIFLARKFVPARFAFFAGLVWLATGFTLTQGFSFRTDPLSAALLMVAIALVLTPALTTRRALFAGGLVGLAGLVTIKAVLYLPAFLGVLAWQLQHRRSTQLALPVAGGTLAAIASFVVLYQLHGWSLGITAAEAIEGNVSFAERAGRSMLLEAGWLPQALAFRIWLGLSTTTLLLAIIGSTRGVTALLFAAPLLSVLFYRNSFPYFYPFITAPVMITVAIGAHRLSQWSRPVFIGVCLLVAFGAVMQTLRALPKDQVAQRQTLAAVHTVFPEPVSYIDRNSMVSSFPKRGFFMTGWGLLNYLQRGEPVMEQLLSSHAPPLLLANSPALELVFTEGQPTQWLLPEDVTALRQSYLPWWGAIHVAGFRMTFPASEVKRHPVRIAGTYRIESEGPLRINGMIRESGDTVLLQSGSNEFAGPADTTARFIWNAAGAPPDSPPPQQPIYYGF